MLKVLIIIIVSMLTTLFTVFLLFLPAVYGIDPTGIGAKLHINGLLVQGNQLVGEKNQSVIQTVAASPTTTTETNVLDQSATIQEDQQQSFTLVVPPKQNLSFRFYMERDYDLDYQWATDGKPLYAELRGQPPEAKDKTIKVFGKLTESKGQGFFIPPFSGNYSLYWNNKTDKAVTIRLTAKGAYKVLG